MTVEPFTSFETKLQAFADTLDSGEKEELLSLLGYALIGMDPDGAEVQGFAAPTQGDIKGMSDMFAMISDMLKAQSEMGAGLSRNLR